MYNLFILVLFRLSLNEILFDSLISDEHNNMWIFYENDSISFNQDFNLKGNLTLINENEDYMRFNFFNGSLGISEGVSVIFRNFIFVNLNKNYIFLLNDVEDFIIEVP